MAQSKSFFGLRKGSTKSLTFQVLNGKQITKDRVYNVKNPQTLAQMQQRALMATVITAYSHLKTICDHSIEGVEVGSKTMSEFISANLGELSKNAPDINLTSYKEGNYVDNFYMVSKGTLLPLESDSAEVSGKLLQCWIVGDAWGETDNITYAKLAEKIGLKKDGMITIMLTTEGGVLYWARMKFTEEILASSKVIAKKTKLITDMQSIDSKSVEGNALELADSITLDEINGKVEIAVNRGSAEMVALIKSIKEGNSWKRSTAYMEGIIETPAYDAALSTYPINTSLLLNGGNMPSNIFK